MKHESTWKPPTNPYKIILIHDNNLSTFFPLQRNTHNVHRANSSPTARSHSNVRYNKLSTKSSSSSNNRSLPEGPTGDSPSHHIDGDEDDEDDYIITTSYDDEKDSKPIIRFSQPHRHQAENNMKKDYSTTCDRDGRRRRRQGDYVEENVDEEYEHDDVDDESATFLPKV